MNHFFVATIWTLAILTYRTKLIAINWKVRVRSLLSVWRGGGCDTVAGQRNNGLFDEKRKDYVKAAQDFSTANRSAKYRWKWWGRGWRNCDWESGGFYKRLFGGEFWLIQEILFFGFIFRKRRRSLLWHALRGGTQKFGRNKMIDS